MPFKKSTYDAPCRTIYQGKATIRQQKSAKRSKMFCEVRQKVLQNETRQMPKLAADKEMALF